MTTSSFTAGERTLPGGRAAVVLLIAGSALVAGCAAPATVGPPATPPAGLGSPADAGAVPTLGPKPPPGLVLPSYFVTVTASANGSIAVLTTPASRCALNVRRPSGATIDGGERVADVAGLASWTYPALADHGESILTVRCTLGDQTQTAAAQVLLP